MSEVIPIAETVTIGGDLTVGRIGFGAMRLTGDQVWGDYPDHDGGIALLRHVVDSGVTFIDTADVYGPHSNEELIREALHPYPRDLVIATKGGFVRGGYDYSTLGAVGNPNYLRQSVHMSLRRLGLERVDLYYLHSGTATDAPFEDQVGVLSELKAQGLVRYIGLSNVTVAQFEAARQVVEIAALTANYNLGTRLGSAHLAAAERAGVVFSPWGPTRFDGPNVALIRKTVNEIAHHHDATAQQVALAWHLQLSPNTLPIPGTTTISHVDANNAAARLRLSHEIDNSPTSCPRSKTGTDDQEALIMETLLRRQRSLPAGAPASGRASALSLAAERCFVTVAGRNEDTMNDTVDWPSKPASAQRSVRRDRRTDGAVRVAAAAERRRSARRCRRTCSYYGPAALSIDESTSEELDDCSRRRPRHVPFYEA